MIPTNDRLETDLMRQQVRAGVDDLRTEAMLCLRELYSASNAVLNRHAGHIESNLCLDLIRAVEKCKRFV